jgi:Cu/Ag efflux pump CusA
MPKLMSVPGVANVSVWGQRARQLQVQVDPQRLRDRGVSLNQVIKSTGDALWVSSLSYLEASTPGAGGWIDTPNQRLGIQHVQPITSPAELATVAIPSTSLRLGDIANVVEDHPPLIGDAIIEDAPGLLLVIEKFANASAVEVVKGVDAALDELRPGLSGIEIHSSAFRATSFIELALVNLRLVLLVAGGLLVMITAAWFKSWRAALVSLATLTLTVLLAAFANYLLGTTINAMVLAGFVTGLVAVAGATVVDLQEFVRRADRERASDGNLLVGIEETPSRGRRSPALYMTLILLLATAPLLLMHGAWGAFVRPFALSFLLALFASMVLALTVSPVLATMLLDRRSRPEGSLARWLQKRYEAALSPLVRAPRFAYLIAGALLCAGLIILPLLRWSMTPSFQERDVRVTWEAAPGTSLPEMRRMMVQASQELRRNPGVREVTAHIGRAVTGDQVVGIESGQIWISIAPEADYDATLSNIKETVQGYPGISGEVENYLTARVRSLLGGFSTDEPLVVRVQGPERDVLQREAARVAQILSDTPGLSKLRVEGHTETPQVEVKVNLTAAGLAGIKPGDVRRAAATIFAGLEVGSLFEKQKVFEVVVWGTPETRQSLTAVHDLLIDTPEDTHVRLADVAEVRVIPTQQVIKREGVSRYLDIRADVAGRNLAAVTREVKARLQKVSFPLEYHSVVLGDYADREAAYRRVLLAALAAAIGV